jgi:hypothetical protein
LLLHQAEVQSLTQRTTALDAAAAAAQAAAVKAEQTASATAAELALLKGGREGAERELRQALTAARAERDAAVLSLTEQLQGALEAQQK